jgi:hypothetical protein
VDGNGGGDRDSSHYKVKNTNASCDTKKMSMLGRDVFRYLQGKTADVIANGEEPPWDALYAPRDMHHYLQGKTTYVIARGDEPPWGDLYAPPVDLCVANPPTRKATKKAKPSSSHRKDG